MPPFALPSPQGSRYAERLPIGTEAVIRRCPADTVRAFYERWYRPENMALVAVGDFADMGEGGRWVKQLEGVCSLVCVYMVSVQDEALAG